MAEETKQPDSGKAWPRVSVAMIDRLTYAEVDHIYEAIGIDIHDDETRMSKKLAACEWLARHKAGQKVTFEEVYNRGTLDGIDVLTSMKGDADPTRTEAGQS